MASTITGTLFNWSITSPGGEVCGAAKNEAQATLDPDGTVVIKSGDAVLWAGHIMSLVGLVGATPALLFADLLNNYLTGSSSQYSLAAARFGVDPSTNPGPLIGGLLFDPTTTTGGNWIVPLTATPVGLGIGDNYEDDADDYFTLTSPTQLTINVTGKYHLSAGFFILSNDTLAPMVVQVLLNGNDIFSAPPGVNSFGPGSTTGTSPISALYSRGYACNGSMDCNLTAGDILTCKLYAEGGSGGDTAEIPLTSALCIHLIGGTSSGAGSGGVTAILNATDSGEALVTGAAPIYSVKRFKAGSGLTVASDATSVTYSATGGTTVDNTSDAGEPLVTGSFPTYEVKRIQALGGLTTASDDYVVYLTGISISNTVSGQPGSLVTGTSPNQQIKRIVAGPGITVTSDANNVTVSSLANNGFNVSGSSGIAFTTTPTDVSMSSYRRNDGLLTWSGTATNSVTSGTVIHFDVGFTITTASTGIITFAVQDSGAGLLVRQYAAGYTGPVSFSGTVKSFYGGTISIKASSTVADGTFSTSSPVDFATNWFAGDLIYAP